MIIGTIKEKDEFENRVSITPESCKSYIKKGLKVLLEKKSGVDASFMDYQYEENGAQIIERDEVLNKADILVNVTSVLDESDLKHIKKNSIIIGGYNPYENFDKLKKILGTEVTLISLDFLPRISRAQSMDILSSQANLAGYKAVIEASSIFKKALPMMMTAAGTIAPAKVMVFGAGVAGLQAIATAKRLGAIVSATDVRMAAKEQVESLGGKFVMVEDDEAEDAETSTGYAKEMSDDFKLKQAKLISDTLASQDIAICTALIPGKKAPRLISREQVNSMKPGSVIIDLAAESGGNCECSKPGETIEENGVIVVGAKNITSTISQDASSLFSKNILNFVNILINAETKNLEIDWEDEIIKGILITKDKKIMNEDFV